MGCLKTFLRTTAVSLLCLAGTMSGAEAQSLETTEARLRAFSVCAGRLRAQTEHYWLFSDPASDQSTALLEQYEELIAAILPLAQADGLTGRDVLNWRVSARLSHRALLQQTRFGDAKVAIYAQDLSTRQIAGCRTLLLG